MLINVDLVQNCVMMTQLSFWNLCAFLNVSWKLCYFKPFFHLNMNKIITVNAKDIPMLINFLLNVADKLLASKYLDVHLFYLNVSFSAKHKTTCRLHGNRFGTCKLSPRGLTLGGHNVILTRYCYLLYLCYATL